MKSMKLFVALDLPCSIKEKLAKFQPKPGNRVRIIGKEQMHVTLHYIGEADVEKTDAALKSISANSFTLTINGAGLFRCVGSRTILWAGVVQNSALTEIHRLIGIALSKAGSQIEKRPYTPHVTLARCESGVESSKIDEFMAQQKCGTKEVRIDQFGLYSSKVVNGRLVYRLERFYNLN